MKTNRYDDKRVTMKQQRYNETHKRVTTYISRCENKTRRATTKHAHIVTTHITRYNEQNNTKKEKRVTTTTSRLPSCGRAMKER